MAKEELLLRLSLLEQEGDQLEEQLKAVDKKIAELEIFKRELSELKENKEKGILAHIGEGIFIEGEIKSKEVLVNIGNKIVIKKKIPEAQEIIEKQINRFKEIKKELIKQIEKINLELMRLVEEVDKKP